MTAILELHGERVLLCEPDGPLIDSEQRAVDLIGDAFSSHATLIAVPVGRLGAAFFDLRSGVAGAIVQKVVIYHVKFAIIGDITPYLAASGALRDWVRECNRRGEVSFLLSLDDLAMRLRPAPVGGQASSIERFNVRHRSCLEERAGRHGGVASGSTGLHRTQRGQTREALYLA